MESAATRKSLLLKIRDFENAGAWEEFVRIYEPLVTRFVLWRGFSHQDAADISQEVMAAVARTIRNFEYDPKKGSFRGWMLTVTRRQIIQLLRKRSRQPVTVPAEEADAESEGVVPGDLDVWELEYRRRLFDWACALVRGQFSDSTWQAFWRTTVEDRTGAEVASELGLPTGAVYVARSRVLQRVREKIASVADEWDVTFDPDEKPV